MSENVNTSATSDEAKTSFRNAELERSKIYFVQRHLSFAFRRLGASCGRHPWFFFLIPILISAALSIRIYWVTLTKEVEYLYAPINARAMKEREAIESIFPPTSVGVSLITLTRLRGLATVLIEAKDGGSVLREEILKEVSYIDSIIYNITVFYGGKSFKYADMCSKISAQCQHNDILGLIGKTEDIRRKRFRIKYPYHIEPFAVWTYVGGLGGVTTDENDYIVDAKAARLLYFLNDTSEEKGGAAHEWELSFQRVLLNSKFRTVNISIATSQSINIEFSRITEMALPFIAITAVVMMIFASVSCMTTEWVTSKPWIAIAGCISPVLAVCSAFGFLLLCGFEYIDLNIIILFLLVGIGLDDSFVMLAAWWRTDPRKEVTARTIQTYEEAAISITITSITNLLSFCIGMIIPYRIVRLYCLYSAVSVVLTYAYQITFFGGALALSGYREKRKRHPLLCITVKEEHASRSSLLKLLYFGYKKIDDEEATRSTLVDSFLVFVTSAWGKHIAVTVFLIYLTTSAYSLRFLKERFDYRNAMPYNSYLVRYFNVHYKYFVHYPHPIHIAINTTLDYSSEEVQRDVDDILEKVSSLPGLQEGIVISWLRFYLQSTEDSFLRFSYRGYNLSKPRDFISALKSVFLKMPYANSFRPHIKFNRNGTQITASRFIVISKDVGTYEKEKELASSVLKLVDSFRYPVHISNFWFPLYSVSLDIRSSTIEAVCTAAVVEVIVFFFFIPHPLCLVGVTFTIISIQIGVLGFMSLWGVVLNPVSMITLIVSVGLSVDYAAHVCYAYLCCKKEDPDEKTSVALRHAGYPIIQGCLSTILGVLVLAFGPSNVFTVFFKIITLVMLIAAFHGIFVIPVMLNVLERAWRRFCKGRRKTDFLQRNYKFSNNAQAKKENACSDTEEDENIKSTCT